MESVLGVVQSPIFLSILIFLGIVALIRVMAVRNSNLKRADSGDRRRTNTVAAFPFQDCDGVLVTENRRVQLDRRHVHLMAMRQGMNGDGATG